MRLCLGAASLRSYCVYICCVVILLPHQSSCVRYLYQNGDYVLQRDVKRNEPNEEFLPIGKDTDKPTTSHPKHQTAFHSHHESGMMRSGEFEHTEEPTLDNLWGFPSTELSQNERELLENYQRHQLSLEEQRRVKTTTPQPLVPDPRHQGLLKDVGGVGVGFGVGVGDYASVNAGVGVSLGGSGLAGGLPEELGFNIFPRQGEAYVLDDYTGNKRSIVADRWRKYWIAVSEGRVSPPPRYAPAKQMVGVGGNVNVLQPSGSQRR